MFAQTSNNGFNDFYESLHSNTDAYDGGEGFGKPVKQASKGFNMKKVISYESFNGAESNSRMHKSISNNSFGDTDYEYYQMSQPSLRYQNHGQGTFQSTANLSSMGQQQTNGAQGNFSASMPSINGAQGAQGKNEKQKSRKRGSGNKRKKGAEVDFRVKYKTEVCKFWLEKGHCQFGDQCAFAHGTDEIRQKVHVSNNYKTKKCQQFHENGYCPYGARCQFIHNISEVIDLKSTDSYGQMIENAELWHDHTDECVCTTKLNHRPRLPTFEKFSCENLAELEDKVSKDQATANNKEDDTQNTNSNNIHEKSPKTLSTASSQKHNNINGGNSSPGSPGGEIVVRKYKPSDSDSDSSF